MQRDAGDHQHDPGRLLGRGHLAEHDHADHRGRGGQQRHEQRVGRARQPRHRELVEHVRDHGGGDADADPGQQRDRIAERRQRRPACQRRHDRGRHQHRHAERVHARALRGPVREHDVEREQRRVGEGERDAERLALELDPRQQEHARHREQQRAGVARRARTERRQADDR